MATKDTGGQRHTTKRGQDEEAELEQSTKDGRGAQGEADR